MKTYKTYEMTNEYLGGRISLWTVGWSFGLSYPVSDNTSGGAGVHEDDLKESSTEFGRDRAFSSSECLHSKQTSS